jgi:hypothetical protein
VSPECQCKTLLIGLFLAECISEIGTKPLWARSMTARFSIRLETSIFMEKRAVIERPQAETGPKVAATQLFYCRIRLIAFPL